MMSRDSLAGVALGTLRRAESSWRALDALLPRADLVAVELLKGTSFACRARCGRCTWSSTCPHWS